MKQAWFRSRYSDSLMADIVDAATRSRMMSGIRGKDTKPELLVRRGLHSRGFRFRLHGANLPGRPDLVLPKYSAAIFVHGCFWHAHDCSLAKMPKTRPDFWKAKLSANQARDARQLVELQTLGFRTLVIWECSLRGPQELVTFTLDRADEWLRREEQSAEISRADWQQLRPPLEGSEGR